jgi:hypothetical protein
MREPGYGYLVVALALMMLAVLIFLPSVGGLGAQPREMAFTGGLHNSLYNLDQAKWKWAEDKHKSDGAIPTMDDLAPYLGDWTNSIKYFVSAGIEYRITPLSEDENQSDVATFTRNVSFQIGFCRFYKAGTRYCLHTGWVYPQYDRKARFLAFYQHARPMVVAPLFLSGIASLLVFAVRKVRSLKKLRSVTNGNHNA